MSILSKLSSTSDCLLDGALAPIPFYERTTDSSDNSLASTARVCFIECLPLDAMREIFLWAVMSLPSDERAYWATTFSMVCKAWLVVLETVPRTFFVGGTDKCVTKSTLRCLPLVTRPFTFQWAVGGGASSVPTRAAVEEDSAYVIPGTSHLFYYLGRTIGQVKPDKATARFLVEHLITHKRLIRRFMIERDATRLAGWEGVLRGELPELRVLRIWPTVQYTLQEKRSLYSLDFHAPFLTTLIISSCIPPPPRFPLLSRLVIHETRRRSWPLSKLFAFLKHTPLLQVLDLDGAFFATTSSRLHGDLVLLDHLCSIKLTWLVDFSEVYHLAFLDRIYAPHLQNLEWQAHPGIRPYIEVPGNQYLEDIRIVVVMHNPYNFLAKIAHPQILYMPDWIYSPRLESIQVMVVVDPGNLHTSDDASDLFPNLRQVHRTWMWTDQRMPNFSYEETRPRQFVEQSQCELATWTEMCPDIFDNGPLV